MKTLLLLFISFLSLTLTSQTIPNNDFENWTIHEDLSGTVMVDSLEGGYFTSGNPMLITLPSLVSGLPKGFMYDTSFAYSGSSAVAMKTGFLNGLVATGNMFSGSIDASVNGIQSVIDELNPLAPALTGVPSTATPSSFSGYFFYEPADMYIEFDTAISGNDTTFNKLDTCKIACLVHKWNSTLMKRDTIAYGEFRHSDTTSGFTFFNIDMNYNQSISGDSISVLFLSSAEGGTGFAGAPGSLLIVDSVYFTGDFLSVDNKIKNSYKLYSFENQVIFSGFDGGETFLVNDLQGRLIKKVTSINKGKNTIYLEKSGIFIISVLKNNKVLITKKVRIN